MRLTNTCYALRGLHLITIPRIIRFVRGSLPLISRLWLRRHAMRIQSIQGLSVAALLTTVITVAAQTMPVVEADVCVLRPSMVTDNASIQLASLFVSDRSEQASLFSDAPLFIYAMNEVARESDGVDLVDVNSVTSCT